MQIPDPVLVSAIVRRAVSECIASNQSPDLKSSDAPFFNREPEEIFYSPAALAIKEEIILTGKKLWERQYVDGNGGNMSVRVAEDYVICTPTLCSKRDMRVEDFSLVNLENCKICGSSRPTSEILLHLEIYKAVPAARAVVHCHPPYATAHAIAGTVPPGNLIPEQEVFVGPVALAPYETPGTMAFARTVLPFVQDHNTVLLANHGIVCWGDTITHAEWYVEVVDTYCKTVMIARQLGSPMNEIPPDKVAELLDIKKRLGLPDPRLAPETSALPPRVPANQGRPPAAPSEETEQLVSALTLQVMQFLEKRG
jgi:L-fuculose-phosphate aldolase